MVLPIVHKGYVLSHPDFVNYYNPIVIEWIDAKGMHYQFKTAKSLSGILWWQSIKHISKLQRLEPQLLEPPKLIGLELMKEKVCHFIPKSKYAPKDEQEEMIRLVKKAKSHRAVIESIDSMGYWK